MRIHVTTGTALMLLAAFAGLAAPAAAERGGREIERREATPRHDVAPRQEPGWVLDQRYRHNRYYPPRGQRIERLPPKLHPIPYRGINYYYHGGIWYRPYGTYFSVVLPPIGLAVSVLPPYYTTIWYGGIPYYYAGGVYYVWHPENRAYIVTEAPPEAEVREQAPVSDSLFVYPKKGQTAQRQATDRYECHRWGVEQTGFDPTQPGGNVPDSEHAQKRADYQRAMKACLEGRDYSVR